jgi:hypothetical protein
MLSLNITTSSVCCKRSKRRRAADHLLIHQWEGLFDSNGRPCDHPDAKLSGPRAWSAGIKLSLPCSASLSLLSSFPVLETSGLVMFSRLTTLAHHDGACISLAFTNRWRLCRTSTFQHIASNLEHLSDLQGFILFGLVGLQNGQPSTTALEAYIPFTFSLMFLLLCKGSEKSYRLFDLCDLYCWVKLRSNLPCCVAGAWT